MKKFYSKPTVEIIHAEAVILAGTTQGDIYIPIDPEIEEEGFGD